MLQPDLEPLWGHAFENVLERCGLNNGWAVDLSSFGGGHLGHLQNLEVPDDFDALVLNLLARPRALLH